MHTLEQKVRTAVKAGRYALIPFLTAGYPDVEKFWQALIELDVSGADIIEIGVPFSDPVADGPIVENASRQVLADGMNLRYILEGLKIRKDFVKAGLVLMGYLNPFLQYGFETFATQAAEGGVSGVIIPDLPYEEATPYREILKKQGIALIALVGPNTSEERMKLYADVSEGYIYVVSVMGTTGERSSVAPVVISTIERARRCFTQPLALGFGLSRPEQLLSLPTNVQPDAAVFGSALLKHLKSGEPVATFMNCWTQEHSRRCR